MKARGQLQASGRRIRALANRIRARPLVSVAIAAGTILVLAWIGWATYVTSEQGVREGLGVLIAWPALISAAALVALPFVGAFILIRRQQSDGGQEATGHGGVEPTGSRESSDSGEAEAEPTRAG